MDVKREKLLQLKHTMLDAVTKEHLRFIEILKKLPANPRELEQALLRFEEGHAWLRKAIMNTPLESVKEA